MTIELTPDEISDVFERDERISHIRVYLDGFVPNAYRYKAPGMFVKITRGGQRTEHFYDRKRSHGIGPRWVAFSEKGGRLASG